MRTVLIALVLAAGTAAAQPAPPRCDVTISRAPDEVRAAVERWLAAEAHCSVALELRVVPTEGGYYVLARDGAGQIRERVVPDAQSAGVLVASWAADDGIRPVPRVSWAAFDGDGAVRPSPDAAARPPGLARTTVEPRSVVGEEPWSHWIGLGVTDVVSANEDGEGIRADIDLASRGRWAIGATASVTRSHAFMAPFGSITAMVGGAMQLTDAKALVYASTRARWRGWHVRGVVGAGFVFTTAQALLYQPGQGYETYTAQGVVPTAEAALLVGHTLGRKLAFEIGPVGSLYAQMFHFEFSVDPQSGLTMPYDVSRTPVQWALVAGLQYRL